MNFGPLTAKNRAVVFTHPLKSSSAWRKQPLHWPALQRANIPSYSCREKQRDWYENEDKYINEQSAECSGSG